MKIFSFQFETATPFRRVALGVVLVWALALAPGTSAAQEKSDGEKAVRAKPTQKPANSNPAKSEGEKGSYEGIKIHGHWVIEVRNPDGKVVTRREFENEYVPGNLLPWVLTRQFTPGFWFVDVYSNPINNSPCAGNSNRNICYIGQGGGFPDDSSNLSSSTIKSDTAILLSGSVTALSNGTIDTVESGIQVCAPTVAPATSCSTGTEPRYALTRTNPPQISVAAGQVIQVTVTITFS
jgi:hypothetical protein